MPDSRLHELLHHRLGLSAAIRSAWIRARQDRDATFGRDQLAKQFDLLECEIARRREAGDIAARPREAVDQPLPHHVVAAHHHDGDRGACLRHGGSRTVSAPGHHHVWLERSELRSQFGQALDTAFRGAHLEHERTSFDVAQRVQIAAEGQQVPLGRGPGGEEQHADARDLGRGLGGGGAARADRAESADGADRAAYAERGQCPHRLSPFHAVHSTPAP